MNCASALSTNRDTETAIGEVLDRMSRAFQNSPADLAVAFVSPHHGQGLTALAEQFEARGIARHLIGCTGESIVSDDREIESEPAVSLWAIRQPGVTLTPIRMSADPGGMDQLEAAISRSSNSIRHLIMVGDPFTFPTENWLRGFDEKTQGVRIIGGMASAGQMPGQNVLVLDNQGFRDGAVAILLEGPLIIRTVVSQGCRPIGRPMLVTRQRESHS